MIHDIKINSRYFNEILTGKKTFEIRFNDRSYKVNDKLILNEILEDKYTGNKATVNVTYILTHDDFPEGIPEGYVVLSIKR